MHLRLPHNKEQLLIEDLIIPAATYKAEHHTLSILVEREFEDTYESFQTSFSIELGNISSIEEIKYLDANQNEQVFPVTDFLIEISNGVASACLKDGVEIPEYSSGLGSFRVKFKAGFASEDLIPAAYKQAILLTMTHYWANREEIVTGQGIVSVRIPESTICILRSLSTFRS